MLRCSPHWCYQLVLSKAVEWNPRHRKSGAPWGLWRRKDRCSKSHPAAEGKKMYIPFSGFRDLAVRENWTDKSRHTQAACLLHMQSSYHLMTVICSVGEYNSLHLCVVFRSGWVDCKYKQQGNTGLQMVAWTFRKWVSVLNSYRTAFHAPSLFLGSYLLEVGKVPASV